MADPRKCDSCPCLIHDSDERCGNILCESNAPLTDEEKEIVQRIQDHILSMPTFRHDVPIEVLHASIRRTLMKAEEDGLIDLSDL